MKNFKRISAVILAILMIAMMIPMTVNAATYSYTMTGKDGYTFTVYKLAEYDVTTGQYIYLLADGDEAALEAALENYDNTEGNDTGTDDGSINDDGANRKEVLEACNALYKDGKIADALAVETVVFNATNGVTQTVDTDDAGVYFVVCTDGPDTYTEVNNSVFQLPYFDGTDADQDGIYDAITSIDFVVGTKVTD